MTDLHEVIRQIIANARMPRDMDVLLDPDWVVIPRELVEQLEDLATDLGNHESCGRLPWWKRHTC